MNDIILYGSLGEMESDNGKWQKFNVRSYTGCVYAVEFGDHVKIGSTTNPLSRLRALSTSARNYSFTGIGRIALTPIHSRFRSNELYVHSVFIEKRIENGELFDIPFEYAVAVFTQMNLRKKNIIDESASFNEKVLWVVQELAREVAEKSHEFSRLKSYAPKGAETFWNLICDYDDKARHAILKTMKSFPIEKQKRILGKIFREKALPDFLKTIAEGE